MKNTLLLISVCILSTLLFTHCSKPKPSCTDGIHNQGETRIDCGGPCTPCGTCVDGLQNQDETGIDCGGPCPKCPTCNDGIMNQGETSVDCGGPCANTCGIKYPESGSFGKNLLYSDTTVILRAYTNALPFNYSLKCEIPAGSRVKVTLRKLDTRNGLWWYHPGSPWQAVPYANSYQEFSAVGPAIADLNILFQGASAVELRVYENDATTPILTKGYLWQ